jgi:hypothetical protein
LLEKKSEWDDEVELVTAKGIIILIIIIIIINFFWAAIPYDAVECNEYYPGTCKTAGSLISAFTAKAVKMWQQNDHEERRLFEQPAQFRKTGLFINTAVRTCSLIL